MKSEHKCLLLAKPKIELEFALVGLGTFFDRFLTSFVIRIWHYNVKKFVHFFATSIHSWLTVSKKNASQCKKTLTQIEQHGVKNWYLKPRVCDWLLQNPDPSYSVERFQVAITWWSCDFQVLVPQIYTFQQAFGVCTGPTDRLHVKHSRPLAQFLGRLSRVEWELGFIVSSFDGGKCPQWRFQFTWGHKIFVHLHHVTPGDRKGPIPALCVTHWLLENAGGFHIRSFKEMIYGSIFCEAREDGVDYVQVV